MPIGQYFLSPFSAPSQKLKTTDEVILPVVPEVQLVKAQSEQQADDHKELGMKCHTYSKCVIAVGTLFRISTYQSTSHA